MCCAGIVGGVVLLLFLMVIVLAGNCCVLIETSVFGVVVSLVYQVILYLHLGLMVMDIYRLDSRLTQRMLSKSVGV